MALQSRKKFNLLELPFETESKAKDPIQLDDRQHRKVTLTSRDLRLMQLLYQSVALSFPQIERMVFEGRSKSTVLNRLARLESGDVIKRMRVHGLANSGATASIKVVFQLTKRGIRELSKVPGMRVERDEPIRLHGHSLVHDILLVDLASALRLSFPSSQTTDGRLWKEAQDPQQPKPDLVLSLPGDEKPWAVELELTYKSE